MLVKKQKCFCFVLKNIFWLSDCEKKKEEQNLEEKTQSPPPNLPHQKIKWSVPKQVFSRDVAHMVSCYFYAPPPESGGVLCYTLRNFECPSVRPSVCLSVCPSVRPSVRPSVSAHHHSCIGNSSYSFRPILLKLYRCFKDGLKICILFFSES